MYARPTWNPAIGGRSIRDTTTHSISQFHVQDLPMHTTLKLRQPGQNNVEDVRKRNLRDELRRAELEHLKKGGLGGLGGEEDEKQVKKIGNGRHAVDNLDGTGEDEDGERKLAIERAKEIDKSDTESESLEDEEEEEEEEEDDSDEDDTAELMRELEKIKRERAEEKARDEQRRVEEEERRREEEVATGNPLISASSEISFGVKRRWDDDVVFKNQTRGVEERPKKRFVNDLLRSEFHRKFISKFIK